MPDSQQIELLGTYYLKTKLVEAGLEVAVPERDTGIDLIVYLELPKGRYKALPVQIKCSSGTRFGVWRKYGNRNMWMAFVWDVQTAPSCYLLPHKDTTKFLTTEAMHRDYKKSGWTWAKAPQRIKSELEGKYRLEFSLPRLRRALGG